MSAIGSLGDRPLRMLVCGHFLKLVPQRDLAHRLHENFMELQQDLARLSTRSKLIVVEDSGHFIHHERPDAVISTVMDVLQLAR